MKKWLGLCLAVMSMPAFAADAPASTESIRHLFEVTQPQRMLEVAKAQVVDSLNTGIKAGLGDTPLTPEQQKILDEYKPQLIALLQEQLDWSVFEPDIIEAYASTFSQKELDAMLAFYESDVGKSVLEKMPKMTQAMMIKMQGRMREMAPKLQRKQHEMIAKIKESAPKAESTPK